MANIREELDELLSAGVITQEKYDTLADLTAAKEAIKEFNDVKRERDDLLQFKTEVEIAPKRAEAVKSAGVTWDELNDAERDYLKRNIPADKLADGDYVAQVVQRGGLQANVQEGHEPQTPSTSDEIRDFSTSVSTLAEPLKAGKVTPKDFASWDTSKQREFMKKHPNAYDALTKGQEAVL